jgi:hypothetical protein
MTDIYNKCLNNVLLVLTKQRKKKKKKKKKKPTPENKNLAEKKNRDELTFIFCIRQLISRHTFNFYFCEITPVCPATIFFN